MCTEVGLVKQKCKRLGVGYVDWILNSLDVLQEFAVVLQRQAPNEHQLHEALLYYDITSKYYCITRSNLSIDSLL